MENCTLSVLLQVHIWFVLCDVRTISSKTSSSETEVIKGTTTHSFTGNFWFLTRCKIIYSLFFPPVVCSLRDQNPNWVHPGANEYFEGNNDSFCYSGCHLGICSLKHFPHFRRCEVNQERSNCVAKKKFLARQPIGEKRDFFWIMSWFLGAMLTGKILFTCWLSSRAVWYENIYSAVIESTYCSFHCHK